MDNPGIRPGDLIGFEHQGKWTVGEVWHFSDRHPNYDPLGLAPPSFRPVCCVEVEGLGLGLVVNADLVGPPF